VSTAGFSRVSHYSRGYLDQIGKVADREAEGHGCWIDVLPSTSSIRNEVDLDLCIVSMDGLLAS